MLIADSEKLLVGLLQTLFTLPKAVAEHFGEIEELLMPFLAFSGGAGARRPLLLGYIGRKTQQSIINLPPIDFLMAGHAHMKFLSLPK